MGMRFFHLCIAIGLIASLGHAQDDRLRVLYQHAKSAEKSGDYKSATADYDKIIQLRPDMAEAYANAGNLYYLQGEIPRAETYFRKAISLKPQLPGPHFFLGVLDFKARDYHGALKSLEEAERLDPSNNLIQAHLGYTEFALHDYSKAAAHLENAANSQGRDIDVFYHLSKAYANLAKIGFRDLKAKFPDSVFTALAAAHAYEAQQNWDLALQQYQRAAAQRPSDVRLRKKVEDIAARKSGKRIQPDASAADSLIDGSLVLLYDPPTGNGVEAMLKRYQQRNQELRNQPAAAEGLYELAEGYQAMSYLASQWVFEIDPNSYRAHLLKGQYYEDTNDDTNAVLEYRKAIESNPALPNIHFLIGNLYWRRDKLDEALPELRKELESDPTHPEALYEVGDIFLTRNQPAQAESYFVKALKFEPNMEEAHLALERIYSGQRQYDKAVLHLRKATEIDPKDPTPHYRLSRVYQQMGKAPESRAELAVFAKLKREQPAQDHP